MDSQSRHKGVNQNASSSSGTRARVLFIVDLPNWAHDLKTTNLMRMLGDDYHIKKRYQSEATAGDFDWADLVLVLHLFQFEDMTHLEQVLERHRGKLLLGVCSHAELEGSRGAAGVAILPTLARGIFANNLRLYAECKSLSNTPVFYTPNGVDTKFYQNAPCKEGAPVMRVGWAGSLLNHGSDHRGYYDFIAPAVNSVSGVELVTAAREDKWRGPEEMRKFYQSLDVYVCASRSEGTPNTCLEAAACGVPLLTTRVGNMPELVRDRVNGFFIERNVSDIASKLRLLRDDRVLRASMAQCIHQDIQSWDWSIRSRAYRQMFEEVIRQKAATTSKMASLPETRKTNDMKTSLLSQARANLLLLPEGFYQKHQQLEVTVVILSHGRLDQTLNAIRALREHVRIPFRLLLIDNGSGPAVQAKLRDVAAEDESIQLILLDENLGCAGGRDLAFKRVTTPYVLLIDNDIEVLPGSIEHLLLQFDLCPQATAATGKVVLPDGTIHLCGADFYVDQGIQFCKLLGAGQRFDEPIGLTGPCDWVPGCLTLIKTDVLHRFPYDPKMRYYFEDNEWCHRVNQTGAGKFYRVVEALGIHYYESKVPPQWQQKEERRKHTMKYVETLAYFYRKHRLVYDALFHFVPELGAPTNQLSIASAKILLELVNSYGSKWVLSRWNREELAPLFAAHSLASQVAEKERSIQELSSLARERQGAVESLATELAERHEKVLALVEHVAERQRAADSLANELDESRNNVMALTTQVAAREAELEDRRNTLGRRLLKLYGKLKYPYLLHLYRLLRLAPHKNERQ